MCQADTGCAAPAAVHFVQEVFRRCRGSQEEAAGVCDAAAGTLEFFVCGNLHLLRKGALRPESSVGMRSAGGQLTGAGSQGFRQALWSTVLLAITKDRFLGALESLLVGLGEELLAWVFPSGVATRRRALEVEMNMEMVSRPSLGLQSRFVAPPCPKPSSSSSTNTGECNKLPG